MQLLLMKLAIQAKSQSSEIIKFAGSESVVKKREKSL